MRDLLLDIDRTRKQRSLEAGLRAAIRAGRLKPGEAVPSSRGLAADLELARATVVAAYDQLVAEGYLAARQGAPTRVAAGPWTVEHHVSEPSRPGLPARSDPWRARRRPIPACGMAALHTRGVGDRSQRLARLRRTLRAGRAPSRDRELPEPNTQHGGDRRLDDRGPRRRQRPRPIGEAAASTGRHDHRRRGARLSLPPRDPAARRPASDAGAGQRRGDRHRCARRHRLAPPSSSHPLTSIRWAPS